MRLLTTVLAACALAAVAPAAAGAADPRLGEVTSFALAIGNHTLDGNANTVADRYARFDLVVVDGEEATSAEIAAIRDRGTIVTGYLSVGTIERWRSWYERLRPYRLSAWQDWRDEWFADTSRPGFRREILAIAAGLLDKGFDGLFLDNTDMVESRRHRAQRRGMGRLVMLLDAPLAADRGALLATQNGHRGMVRGYPRHDVAPLHPYFDAWNREDVSWTWDFDRRRYVRRPTGERNAALAELDDIAAEGLLTSATDYVDVTNDSPTAECEAYAYARGHGALPYLGDIGLTLRAVEANPPACG